MAMDRASAQITYKVCTPFLIHQYGINLPNKIGFNAYVNEGGKVGIDVVMGAWLGRIILGLGLYLCLDY